MLDMQRCITVGPVGISMNPLVCPAGPTPPVPYW